MTRPTLGSTYELDRQSDRRRDPEYLAALMQAPATRFILLVGGRPVLAVQTPPSAAATADIRWFSKAMLDAAGLDLSDPLFLGIDSRDRSAAFAVATTRRKLAALISAGAPLTADTDLRELATRALLPEPELALIGLAKALGHWHENARCCGRCGGVTKSSEGGWKRQCWSCGRDHFPRLDPVVIMLVIHPDGDRCLLAHEIRFRDNMFSALAGYVEPGEDIEHAVRREVFEETGVKVGQVRFIASQPWPFPHTLMIGCFGSGLSEEIAPDAIEIAEARWFTRSEALGMLDGTHPKGLFVPGRQAIAHTLIRRFATGEGV